VLSISPANADPLVTMTTYNISRNLAWMVTEMYIKRSEEEDWSQVHGFGSLFHDEPFYGYYDFRIRDSRLSFYRRMNVNITGDTIIRFSLEDREPQVTILNMTERPIVRINKRLSETTEWIDVPITPGYLVFEHGLSRQVLFDYPSYDFYDFRIEDDLGNVYLKRSVDVSRNITLNIGPNND
jgi:hypothetical protein